MQWMARFLLICAVAALLTGCKNKDEGLETDPAQDASGAYQDPSATYYAPETTTGQDDPYAQAGGSRTHVVAKGDTLYSLARQYYSDQSKWKAIYEANSNVIKNPNLLIVGQTLVIP